MWKELIDEYRLAMQKGFDGGSKWMARIRETEARLEGLCERLPWATEE